MRGVRTIIPAAGGPVLAAAPCGHHPATGSEEPALAWNNGVATTPPMGWNSYDSYNWNVTEAQVKANADYMRDNLKQHGWQYIVIDWAWYYPGSGTGSPNQDANLQPRLRTGRQRPAAARHHPVPLRHGHQRVQAAGRLHPRRRA